VGDSVTWTNRDSAAHTATASGGGFNTGTLKQGQSATHRFTTAGRFAYICAIHPNMKGTVVVTPAAGSAGSGGSSGGASDAGTTGSTPAASDAGAGGSSSLPHTGLQLLTVALLGLTMTAAGRLLRVAVGRRADVRR
jgi:hypothetical protein